MIVVQRYSDIVKWLIWGLLLSIVTIAVFLYVRHMRWQVSQSWQLAEKLEMANRRLQKMSDAFKHEIVRLETVIMEKNQQLNKKERLNQQASN